MNRFWLAALLLTPLCVRADVVADLARQFDRHSLVMIGEFHRSREIHALLQTLLHDPRFVCRADDVVVEFGNSRLQALADAYIDGTELTDQQRRSMWRETAVPLTWNSPLYEAVYASVREVNQRQLCDHRVRLVLADAPLDWARIHNVEDYRAFVDRDSAMATVVEREVLARGHRALVITGQYHVLRDVPSDLFDGPDAQVLVQRLERAHPGCAFVAVAVPVPEAAMVLKLPPPPSLTLVQGRVGRADFGLARSQWKAPERGKQAPETRNISGRRLRMRDVVDALLNLGGDHSVYPSPTIYLDTAFQVELRRRASIIKDYGGQDFLSVIDDLVRQGEREAGSSTSSH